MPKRTDIQSILLIGSGPIVIGQACEFDYSGTQACRILRQEGYRVILANSNPATIMTDPEFADATYVEPLDVDVLTAIIERERPDALLPTLGGQTALNLAMQLFEAGVLEKYSVELIGADAKAIAVAEDREQFKAAMQSIGLAVPKSGFAHNMDDAMQTIKEIGYPTIIRPSYILGGFGTGIANDEEEFKELAAKGLEASPIGEILIEQSIAGWKEYELEVMRDRADNCVIICSIENVDPMGVHTGDSITVAPIQTLTDIEYQKLRDAAFACIRRVGVETGGSNVQFAVHPETGELVVIEMNPRVSRSSALASKATGFPIAKIAARLAVGYTLDEITNDITKKTPASFEPTIDYVVTKIPRWAFEKFPGTSPILGTRMQSVGEAMGIGRTFAESFQKTLRSLENGRDGLNCDPGEKEFDEIADDELMRRASIGTPMRPFQLEALVRRDIPLEKIYEHTKVDPWFLDQIARIVALRNELAQNSLAKISASEMKTAKQFGFSDAQMAYLWNCSEQEVREKRLSLDVRVTYKTVDTCGAEFSAETPYYYGTYEDEDEVVASDAKKVIILGAGPNRIGQGIEFDYCCVHAAFALHDAGYEAIMVNCNPETVSTDYDTSDRLYFEPLTYEDVMNVIEAENPVAVIVGLGGQTPLKLADRLPKNLIAGTAAEAIDRAEDREQWNALCNDVGLYQPPGGTALSNEDAMQIAEDVGFPVLVRPSYVLGGRAMTIVYDKEHLSDAMDELRDFGSLGREGGLSAQRPVLIDHFLQDAVEVDVDAIRDAAGEVIIGGVMEHVEEAGVHSGDSSCVIPPPTLSSLIVLSIEQQVRKIAEALGVIGPLNVQFAVKFPYDPQRAKVYVIEANPRASRTLPFVAKATGVPLAQIAARVMMGKSLRALRDEGLVRAPVLGGHVSVKAPVLPFDRFPEFDTVLGPEMRSTGEVMGVDETFGLAFAKAQLASGVRLPSKGAVFLSLANRDKPNALLTARKLVEQGFTLAATTGTAEFLTKNDIPVERTVDKITDQWGDTKDADAVQLISSGQVQMVINTPEGERGARTDGAYIRAAAKRHKIPCLTTMAAAQAAAAGIADVAQHQLKVRTLQELHSVDQPKLPEG